MNRGQTLRQELEDGWIKDAWRVLSPEIWIDDF